MLEHQMSDVWRDSCHFKLLHVLPSLRSGLCNSTSESVGLDWEASGFPPGTRQNADSYASPCICGIRSGWNLHLQFYTSFLGLQCALKFESSWFSSLMLKITRYQELPKGFTNLPNRPTLWEPSAQTWMYFRHFNSDHHTVCHLGRNTLLSLLAGIR